MHTLLSLSLSHTHTHTQRYDSVVRSGNLNVNDSLVEELRDKCLEFSWEDAVSNSY